LGKGFIFTVDLVDEVLEQLDLVADLGTADDGDDGAVRMVERLGKVEQLLVHEVARGALGKVDAHNGRVCAVGSAKGVVDIDIAAKKKIQYLLAAGQRTQAWRGSGGRQRWPRGSP